MVDRASGKLVGILLVVRNLAYVSKMQSTIAYSRKLVALGRLTAGIAHEVKNPLNAMMIHLELLRMKIRKSALVPAGAGPEPVDVAPPDEGLLQHVGVIEREIRRLDEVVQGFLKFTRPEDLRLQPVSVPMLLDEIRHLRHARVELNARCMVRELERPDALSDLALEALVLESLVHAGRLVRASGRNDPPWLRRAEDLVRDRFREALRIADVAE